MNRKILSCLLAAEAALCILFVSFRLSFTGIFTSALAFPFEQTGAALRALSVSGRLGNAAALALYVLIGLIPVWLLLRASARRRLVSADSLLALLSVLLFVGLYLMINPGRLTVVFPHAVPEARKIMNAVLGGVIWSVIIGYMILCTLRVCFHSDTDRLQRYLGILLGLLAMLFVASVFGAGLSRTLTAFEQLNVGNAGNEGQLGMSRLFVAIRFGVEALPWLLDIVTVFRGLVLLEEMRAEGYSQAASGAAERLSVWCKNALTAVVLSNIGFNILQLLFARRLRDVNGSVTFPVAAVCFAAAALLLSRIIEENRRLKSDNDLFI